MNEITILHDLDHHHICRYYETYDDPKYLYLVMELIDGVPLFKKLTDSQN
jgi:serine/threonine protein kinase